MRAALVIEEGPESPMLHSCTVATRYSDQLKLAEQTCTEVLAEAARVLVNE
jgi:hypothetical protein